MFKLTSNMESVLLSFLQDVEQTELDLPETLRRAAIDAVALIAHRIQQKGEDANGNQLRTKAKLIMGAYSRQWATSRSGRGRQIDHVDLTDTGDMMRNFQVLDATPRLVTAGFLSDKEADKAEYLEAMYGTDIVYLSDSEQKVITDGIEETVFEKLDK